MKSRTNLTIDHELHEEAKSKGINMSDVLDSALKHKLKYVEEMNDKDICDFCKKIMERATKEQQYGLKWLCPDEVWICPECLKDKIEKLKSIKGNI